MYSLQCHRLWITLTPLILLSPAGIKMGGIGTPSLKDQTVIYIAPSRLANIFCGFFSLPMALVKPAPLYGASTNNDKQSTQPQLSKA